jgi:hypothetical protein
VNGLQNTQVRYWGGLGGGACAPDIFGYLSYYQPRNQFEADVSTLTNNSILAISIITATPKPTNPSFTGFVVSKPKPPAPIEILSASSLKYTDPIRGSGLKNLAKNDIANGIKEPVKYTVINGEKYIVDGNHRTVFASYLKLPVPAQRVSLPYQGFLDTESVLENHDLYGNPFSSPSVRNFFKYYKR